MLERIALLCRGVFHGTKQTVLVAWVLPMVASDLQYFLRQYNTHLPYIIESLLY